jgi:hypothetical protein
MFGLYLTSKSVGNAELTIGGIDTSKFKGAIVHSPLTPNSGFDGQWPLTSPKIYVNGESSPILKSSRVILFDSGTSNALFDTNVTEVLTLLTSV